MKVSKINFVMLGLLAFGGSLRADEVKSDIMSFLMSFNTYATDLMSFNTYATDNYNIKYSPTELSIKKVMDALPKFADSDSLMLENRKYTKDKIYNFIALALKEKVKNFDQLNRMLNDYRLVEKESSKKEDAENLLRMAKIFKDRKSAASGQLVGPAIINMYDAIPTESDIIKAISANNKYMSATSSPNKADVKKAIENLIKDKQQILKDLDAAFKKMPVPAPTNGSHSASSGKVAAGPGATGVAVPVKK